MMYDRHSLDYQLNQMTLREMEEIVPMTAPERSRIREWVRNGHPLGTNPWDYSDEEGYPLNFLQAFRLHYGCPSGPWDYWKGPETQALWDDDMKCFRHRDDL